MPIVTINRYVDTSCDANDPSLIFLCRHMRGQLGLINIIISRLTEHGYF